MFRPQQPRTLGSIILRTLVPRSILFAALAAALLVGNAMSVDPLAAPTQASPAAVPAWTASEALAHPDCVPAKSWPAGRLAAAVVGYSFRAETSSRIPFDRAWAMNHDKTTANDVWVIGVCP